jgi:outer membrane protein TolC
MNPARRRIFARLSGLRFRAWKIPLVGTLLSLGCTTTESMYPPEVARSVAPTETTLPVTLPPPTRASTTASSHAVNAEKLPVAKRAMPIALDTVLRLAEEQNSQVGLAREKLNDSQLEKSIADLSWVPDLRAGMAAYRHEGGIQNEDGTLTKSSFGALYPGLDVTAKLDLKETMYKRVSAERKVWQEQGELARVTSEVLLEAAGAYVDLLTARTGEADLKRIQAYENDALKWVEALLKQEKSAQMMAESAHAQVEGRKLAISQIHAQGDAAAAKLAYLLGLPPEIELVPAESALLPIKLVDADQPTEALVSQALEAGPGIRELEQMLAVIQNGIDRARGAARFLPVVEMCMNEGAFGAGPNDSLSWTNRLDLGAKMYWNLTDLLTAKDKVRLAHSRLEQAQLGYTDLRGKLTLGVQEAQQTIQASREQIAFGTSMIQHADKSYKLSDLRLKQRVEGSSTTEVLALLRGLEMAHLNALNAIREHNKAQVRLMVLIGAAAAGEPHHK